VEVRGGVEAAKSGGWAASLGVSGSNSIAEVGAS
jgi:hypothetical protein